MVYQHTVATVGDIERDILVRLLGAGAAVAVPGLHRLTVTHQRGKALSQPVDGFAHAEIQTLEHVVAPAIGVLHIAVIFQLTTGDTYTVTQKIQRPELAFGDAHAQAAALEFGKFSVVLHLYVDILQDIEWVMWAVIQSALEVFHPYTYHSFLRREKAQGKQRGIQLPGSFADIARRGIDHHLIPVLFNVEHLNRVNQIKARLDQPVSVANFHSLFL